MANGDHDWVANEVVTAANMDDYLQLQTVQKFASAAARDTALSARKREGMVTVQDDLNMLTVYSGAAWSSIGPVHGALTSWTPTVTQGVSVTVTNTISWYMRIGRLVIASFNLAVTGAGTAANTIGVTIPVTAEATATYVFGFGYVYDSSATARWDGGIVLNTNTSCSYLAGVGGPLAARLGATLMTAGLAAGDGLAGLIAYQAAGDA